MIRKTMLLHASQNLKGPLNTTAASNCLLAIKEIILRHI